MFILAKQFSFSAAHRILDLPEGHASGRLHGHNWGVEVVFHFEDFDDREMAANGLAPIGEFIKEKLDHRTMLRDDDPLVEAIHDSEGEGSGCLVLMEKNPSPECIATMIYWSMVPLGFDNVAAVRVSETPDAWVEARMELE